MCPEIFEMNGEVAAVKLKTIPDRLIDACLDAAEMCPAFAIIIDV
jgi:ferredoxin